MPYPTHLDPCRALSCIPAALTAYSPFTPPRPFAPHTTEPVATAAQEALQLGEDLSALALHKCRP